MSPSIATLAAKQAEDVDSRYHLSAGMRRQINKVFPTHWSFLLGEIALYSFVILLLSGTYLTLFYDPSMTETIYEGAYAPLRGVEMTKAYATTLDLSFEVRGGLFIRQIHHWAALLFACSIIVHMMRIFFTGAFRRPREANWVIGSLLLILAMFEGFFGYSLPDDLLSGTGLRAAFSGITISIPVIGTWMHWLIFNGDFPGTLIIPRLYVAHVLLLPAIILALIAAHLALVWYQKHTQFPGPGRTETNVVGVRILPVFAVKSGAFFAMTFGVLAVMGGVLQINPVWALGPYNPSQVSAGSQPDFYMMWTDGLARLWPAWELYIGNYMIPAVFWVAVIMGAVFAIMIAYPWIEKRFTKDDAHHNLLQRPRDVPVRTAVGAMAIAFYVVLTLSCVNDIIAYKFSISLNAMTWIGRIGLVVLPPIVYLLTYRFCIGLQRSDRQVLEHGIETGVIKRLPHGAYVEIHQPLGPVDDHGHPIPLEYQGAAIPKKMNKLGSAGKPGSGSIFTPDSDEEHRLHERLSHEGEHDQLTMLRTYQAKILSQGNGHSNGNGSSNGHSNGSSNGHSNGNGSSNGNGHGPESNGH
ncbi:cytochrome bc complex cytochrome b subunit [Rhodococcus sp. BP-349]|uniref:cytochrome bc1 complex cytochrome b subunit n=1 Tax=unclassified Rhodococcus (in: high G+C Gram-positive bacteria) TaxID=192944 RepID=UPI001C9AD9BA|nr:MULTISPECIES: cytochrome bc complex cytochrome b subunit [unclassified Rhodococcus (in: high G+C Gram-positive bacteria)]MBY6540701.1 cytochrome bc complex cytochrome b subunit [Rhodococcus sp. BP-363]MBY6545274.1 cytochrome bc complex cytochrome b subunit [Rhodococcus sp. BP-369]MBY6564504.1 cytochrome bc complex cytochrome b subunit [Rhodococcus sp. BP-370]MBY6578560.1 cytochrome bc complex cytochrome b subunit [Rhodococcus sp. BP-364]MBY6587861.1 cytochrome bc complex cytochrome b subuni